MVIRKGFFTLWFARKATPASPLAYVNPDTRMRETSCVVSKSPTEIFPAAKFQKLYSNRFTSLRYIFFKGSSSNQKQKFGYWCWLLEVKRERSASVNVAWFDEKVPMSIWQVAEHKFVFLENRTFGNWKQRLLPEHAGMTDKWSEIAYK